MLTVSHLQTLFAADINSMYRALDGDGFKAGLCCTPGSGITVSLGAGSGFIDGASWANASTKAITLCASDADYDRRDTIFFSKSLASATFVTGTAAILPKPKTLPASHIPLHEVYIPTGEVQLTASLIVDKRVMFPQPQFKANTNTTTSGTAKTIVVMIDGTSHYILAYPASA